MGIYSATALIPATGVLYALALAATRGEQVSMELAILPCASSRCRVSECSLRSMASLAS